MILDFESIFAYDGGPHPWLLQSWPAFLNASVMARTNLNMASNISMNCSSVHSTGPQYSIVNGLSQYSISLQFYSRNRTGLYPLDQTLWLDVQSCDAERNHATPTFFDIGASLRLLVRCVHFADSVSA